MALTDGHVVLPQVLKSADQKVLWASGTQCEDELDEWERGHVELALEGPPPQPEPPPLFYVLCNILQSASYMAVRFSSICYQFRSASPSLTRAVWQDAAELATSITPNLTFVDPYTLGLLVKCHTGAVDCSR